MCVKFDSYLKHMSSKIKLLLILSICSLVSNAKDFPEDSISMLALGDSYTIGQSVDSLDRWPVQLVDSLQSKGRVIDHLEIRAVTGWTTTSLLNSLKNDVIDRDFNVVSLLIGVNNYYQGRPESLYIVEFQELLDSAVRYCALGKKGVFVVSIPDYGYTPFGESNQEQISALTDRYNFIGDSISKANDIEFINITDLSRMWTTDPSLVATDQLHPSGKQYTSWVTRVLSNSVQSLKPNIIDPGKIPATQISGGVWEFSQSAQVEIYYWNGQLSLKKQVNRGEVMDFTKEKGSVMIIYSKTERWSIPL
jgi:acyl-CoA thioesterase-1